MALVEFDLSRTYKTPGRNPHDSVWTPERIQKLHALWQEGLSASEIAGRLHVSRSAIIGKLHRTKATKRAVGRKPPRRYLLSEIKGRQPRVRPPTLKLLNVRAKSKRSKQNPEERAKRLLVAESMRERLSRLEIVDLSAQQLKTACSLMNLDSHTCRWPLGHQAEDKPLMFCGSEPFLDHPYCHSHCQMAYERVAR